MHDGSSEICYAVCDGSNGTRIYGFNCYRLHALVACTACLDRRLNLLLWALVNFRDRRWVLQHLFRRSFKHLSGLLLVFKQKGQLLQRLAKRLGEEEVDEDDLEAEPADIRQQVLPADISQTDGVDKAACFLLTGMHAEKARPTY